MAQTLMLVSRDASCKICPKAKADLKISQECLQKIRKRTLPDREIYLIWIWSLVFDTPISQILALY